MSAFAACGGQPPRLVFVAILFALALQHPAIAADPVGEQRTSAPTIAEGAPAATAGEPIIIRLDQAKILKLPEKTTTLVVGNPLIADASVQPGGIIVLTAKSFGVTNLVALDRNGATLMEHPVQVLGPADNVVVLYRGVERESYSCMPNCERRIMLGDSATYFSAIMSQSTTLSTQAQSATK
jgi:Flp pilus assembly secretin CpaC